MISKYRRKQMAYFIQYLIKSTNLLFEQHEDQYVTSTSKFGVNFCACRICPCIFYNLAL